MVARIEKPHRSGQSRQPVQGPGPPDFARHREDGARSAGLCAVAQEKAKVRQKPTAGHAQQRPDTRILQRSNAQSAAAQNRSKKARDAGTKPAVGVEEKPAAGAAFLPVGEFIGQIQSGKLRALAVSGPERVSNIPTLKEQGVDVELANWRGVVAPPGISDEAKKELVVTISRMVESKPWQETLKTKDWTNLYLSGDQFTDFLKIEQTRIKGVLTQIGLVK